MSALEQKFILTSGFFQSLENKFTGGGGKVQSFNICDLLSEKEYKASPSSSQASPPNERSEESRDSPSLLKKIRKARTIFTERQLQELETNFQRHKYLTVAERQVLAHRMGLSEIQVKTWYQNRRTKWKKELAPWLTPHPLLLFLQQTVIPLHSSAC